jgi:hypothetical protein
MGGCFLHALKFICESCLDHLMGAWCDQEYQLPGSRKMTRSPMKLRRQTRQIVGIFTSREHASKSQMKPRWLSGAADAIDAYQDDRIRNLKQKLWEQEGVPSQFISLSHAGPVSDDEMLVAACRLQPHYFQADLRSTAQVGVLSSKNSEVELRHLSPVIETRHLRYKPYNSLSVRNRPFV